ncbi:hypothetical protein IU486_20875 [Streptomyces gardneri]|uniref:hypothetical protein n=1 Tax=Nocardia TaxID=1817 RepID=UPI00135CA673|nr:MULTISPECIES: hypothetical protein [Nocardia]MBF6167185.1 hypothetical protein [Streptomyces gardneri]MBF6204229.1 hypothetical protein [Streptomyces gardneri]UAK30570.1 hypothetical protein K8O92_22000 [Nocardia asteroides]
MIRTAGFVGALALAGAAAMLSAGTAQAAVGTVTINGERYEDPVGCLNTDHTTTLLQSTIGNSTDRAVTFYSGRDCTGSVLGELQVATLGFLPKGGSILVS